MSYGVYTHPAPLSQPGCSRQEVFCTQDFPHTPLIWVHRSCFPQDSDRSLFCFGECFETLLFIPQKYRPRQTAAIKIKVSNVYTIPGQNTMDHLMIVTCTKWIA